MINPIFRRPARLLVALLLVPISLAAQQPALEYQGAEELGLQLRRLGQTKRVLMIGAHPDDESTQILSALALGEGATVAYLALTRGEGGQNGIGPELQEGLGLLRSEELLAARRLDGARQYFTRAYDFGFSKHADEAFLHWPREELLRDVVAVIREFRPDVILSVFSGTERDGHGQHQVAGILAREAFEVAGSTTKFPDLRAAGLAPFTPARLYLSLWGGSDEGGPRLDTGELDPLLGQSYYQVAMASRSRHRSQDMGRPLSPGPQVSALQLAASHPGAPAGASIFAGVDTTLSDLAGDDGPPEAVRHFQDFEARASAAREAFNPLRPEATVAGLQAALRSLRAGIAVTPPGPLRQTAQEEERETVEALASAARLELDALADVETLVPGQSFGLTVTFWNGGAEAVRLRRLEPVLPEGWRAVPREPSPATVGAGSLATRRFEVTVASGAEPTRPYFLRQPRDGDLYRWPEGRAVGIPFEGAAVRAVAEAEVAGELVATDVEVTFQVVDRRAGESRRPLRVVPPVSLRLDPAIAVVPLPEGDASNRAPQPLRLSLLVRSHAPDARRGTIELQLPAGWNADPASARVELAPGAETRVDFAATPPAGIAAGAAQFAATFVADGGERYDEGFALIDYPHVAPQPLFAPAAGRVSAFPVTVPAGLRVGYIEGAGDDAPVALAQLGVEVTPLSAADLQGGDLDRFDAILTGIRAYEVRPDLVASNDRLLEYARRGGTVVVQYNKYEYTEPGIAPYPVEMARPHDRVTDETAAVRLLDPRHPAFTWPNRITAADFEGWHQERGLYFLSEWDERFTPLLEMADPGEAPNRGSLMVASHGEGIYVYTGLAFFRQLPEGVPGAYRLLVNLLSLGKAP